jgi:hypothetical protein
MTIRRVGVAGVLAAIAFAWETDVRAQGGQSVPSEPETVLPADASATPGEPSSEPQSVPTLPAGARDDLAPEPQRSTASPEDTSTLEARVERAEARAERAEAAAADAKESADSANAALAELSANSDQERLKLYGFADVGLRKIWLDRGSAFRGVIGTHPEFLLGNVNVYFDAQPEETMRALVEVRFTTYPYGFLPNQIYDVASPNGRNTIIWSGIVLERAQLQWSPRDEFALLGGYFLTPYGIWNVDHGAPVLISSALPDFFATEYFPTHQLGLQALGAFELGGAEELGYRLYVTNGRSPTQGDTDDNKNVGGRVFLRSEGDTTTSVGASGFVGSYDNPADSVRYREWGVGADASVDSGPLRLRSEWVANRVRYATGRRPVLSNDSTMPDHFRWDAYFLAAYALPWGGLEPYLYAEYGRRPATDSDSFSISSMGLNVNFSPVTRLKLQYFRVNLYRTSSGVEDGFHVADARWVTAF